MWSKRIISFRPITSNVTGVAAVAVDIRTLCPARLASPRKSPWFSMATTPSLPVLETTDNSHDSFLNIPDVSAGFPCEKNRVLGGELNDFFCHAFRIEQALYTNFAPLAALGVFPFLDSAS